MAETTAAPSEKSAAPSDPPRAEEISHSDGITVSAFADELHLLAFEDAAQWLFDQGLRAIPGEGKTTRLPKWPERAAGSMQAFRALVQELGNPMPSVLAYYGKDAPFFELDPDDDGFAAVLDEFLPSDAACFGRESKLLSRVIFRQPAGESKMPQLKIEDPNPGAAKRTLCEVWSQKRLGHIWGSRDDGETVGPRSGTFPQVTELSMEEARRLLLATALATLAIRHDPGRGNHHEEYIGLCGFAAQALELPQHTVAQVMEVVTRRRGDRNPADAQTVVASTFERIERGERVAASPFDEATRKALRDLVKKLGGTVKAARPARANANLTLVREHILYLFHTEDGRRFAMVKDGRTLEVEGPALAELVTYILVNETGIPPSRQEVQTILASLAAIARAEGDLRQVAYRRAVGSDGQLWFDLGGGRFVEIGDTITLRTETSLVFFQERGMLPLPEPILEVDVAHGLDLMRSHWATLDDDTFLRALMAALAAMRPGSRQYLTLQIAGPAGSGKTSIARQIASFIDHRADLFVASKEQRDIEVAMRHRPFVALDNVSRLSKADSDFFAQLNTGYSSVRRRLYHDTEEVSIAGVWFVMLTCVAPVVVATDLASRTITLELPARTAQSRSSEDELWEAWERDLAEMLGAMLKLVQAAHTQVRSEVVRRSIADNPRLLDVALWAEAAGTAIPGYEPGTFARLLNEGVHESYLDILDGSPFGSWLLRYLKTYSIEGLTMGEIQQAVTSYANLIEPGASDRVTNWPRSGRAVSTVLRLIEDGLKAAGVAVIWHDKPRPGVNSREVTLRLMTGHPDTIELRPTAFDRQVNPHAEVA